MDDICTGASNDIQRATKTAREMVTKYGMSDLLGPMTFGSDNDEVFIGMSYGHTRDYSEKVAAEIDSEVRKIIDDAYQNCLKILSDNIIKLHNVANALIEREKLDGDEFEEIFAKEELIDFKNKKPETVDDTVTEKPEEQKNSETAATEN